MKFYLRSVKVLHLMAIFIVVLFISFTFFKLTYTEQKLVLKTDISSSPAIKDINKSNQAYLPTSSLIESQVSLLFFGDVMLDRHVEEKIEQYGFNYLFANLVNNENSFIKNYDLVGCNLEGAVTDSGSYYPPVGSYDFAFNPDIISKLKSYNINFINLANNHIADQGERGIKETRVNLDRLGFNFAGCEDGKVDECSSTVIEIKGKKIGLAGFSMVYNKIEMLAVSKVIQDLASSTDLVIVNIHWGQEYEHQYNQAQQQVAYALIDIGADIIIGHHPHVVQGIEIYNNKPIFYSLGNFIFDQYFSPDTQQGLAIEIKLNGSEVIFSLLPLESRLSQVSLIKDEDRQEFFNKLVNWSNVDSNMAEQILSGKIKL